jgi:hypothetical protein
MYKELIATTTLGSLVGIGERFHKATPAKPGNYNVYKVFRNEGDYDCAILFAHESETQDVNRLLSNMDVTDVLGVDGGTYGILNMKDENDTWNSDRFDEWLEYLHAEEQQPGGYVIGTNYGDGYVTLYMNNEHSAFLLDDEDLYFLELVSDCGTYDNDEDYSYEFEPRIEVEYGDKTKVAEPSVDKRKIDVIAELMKELAQN